MNREKLVAFLYLLMRDSLPAGEVEKQLKEAEYAVAVGGGATYSSPILRDYAEHIATRLLS